MNKNVVIFTSSTCGYCTMAKEFFKENDISYEERNISTDVEARKELMSKGFMAVPIIYVDDEVLQGFDKPRLTEIFEL